MTKDEKKELVNNLYKEEENRWNNIMNAYFKPRGAPARLSNELLQQFHERNRTGIKHPQEYDKIMVKGSLDENSFTVKNFISTNGARSFISKVQANGLEAEIVDSNFFSNLIKGVSSGL